MPKSTEDLLNCAVLMLFYYPGEVTTNPDCAHIEALLLEIFQDTLGIITEVVSRLDDPENRMIATRPSTIDTPMTPMTHFKDQTFSEASTSTVPV